MTEMLDFIGSIPMDSNSFWEEHRKKDIFINGNNQVQINVQCLMSAKYYTNEERMFTGFLNKFEEYGMQEEYHKDDITREENVKNILSNYFIVFKPNVSGRYFIIEDIALCAKPKFYQQGMSFVSVAYFKEKGTIEEYIRQITKSGIRSITGLSNTAPIPYILWQQKDTSNIYLIGRKEGFKQWENMIRIMETGLVYYQLNDFEKSRLILNPRNERECIGFVETEVHSQLLKYLETEQEIIVEPPKTAIITSSPVSNPVPPVVSETIAEPIVNKLKELINKDGFSYSDKDLINFHTAMKLRSFVVLEGISGIGKSRLVNFYRQALNLTDEQYRFVSVRSSWTDESDLLGYPDMINQLYRPDHDGVVDLLIEAQKNPEKMYLLCLDEMNLARVEHYLSQFLSALEMPEGDRWISLYNKEIELKNATKYPARIQLKDNVLFVGTINRDETTYHFSDKVLDRVNIIQLGVSGLKDVSYITSLNQEELALLEEMHNILQKSQWNKGIGYRIIKQIDQYMSSLSTTQSILSRQDALDLQIKQRILSKLRGDRSSFEGILLVQGSDTIPLLDCLNKYVTLSNFEDTKLVIDNKVKELTNYGYTM
ncbi:MAG: hypothetical protein ATN36_00650 [Epulopiscium sp. Nele67-Bin005]|nr:MAG: hypothetical protein ATN36_00650 [Epulopiscium sp. Nele67-Bin005]